MILGVSVEDLEKMRNDGPMFHNEFHLPGSFDVNTFIDNWTKFINANIGAIWKLILNEEVAGYFGGMIVPDINDAQLVAQETFWYVKPEHRRSARGLSLLLNFENWAEAMGAKRIIMTHLCNQYSDALRTLYLRRGYTPLEINYVKEL
jgi:hypothetical protein